MSHLITAGMALLNDIEAFLEKHEMSPTALGDRALGDRHFVRQLRQGRRVWPETEGKVRAFMCEHEKAVADASLTEPEHAIAGRHRSTGQINELSGACAGDGL